MVGRILDDKQTDAEYRVIAADSGRYVVEPTSGRSGPEYVTAAQMHTRFGVDVEASRPRTAPSEAWVAGQAEPADAADWSPLRDQFARQAPAAARIAAAEREALWRFIAYGENPDAAGRPQGGGAFTGA